MDGASLLRNAAVVGAGLMGTQIAVVLCRGSRLVSVTSRHEQTLRRARSEAATCLEQLHQRGAPGAEDPETVLAKIRFTQRLPEALDAAELVVESIPEDLPAKQALFKQIEANVSPGCLLVSNTSSLPISILAESVSHRGRMAGSHFVQPAHIVPVVEVISGRQTDPQTVDRLANIWKTMGKIPLQVKRDLPGFLINRLQHALIREAVRLLAQGVASVEDIDAAVRLGLGPRFVTAGPLEQRDLNGLQMHRQVAAHLWKFLDGWEEPLAYLDQMVEQGNTGLESGKGFYDWSGEKPGAVRSRKNQSLARWCERALQDWDSENNGTPAAGR